MIATVLTVAKTVLVATAAVHGATYTVASGDTLSGIASAHGTTWQQLYDNPANHEVIGGNPNVIRAGEVLQLTDSASPSSLPVAATGSVPVTVPAVPPTAPAQTSSGGAYVIPGMPSSLAQCIAFRESTDGTNPAANGNVFGIIPASGYNVAGDSLAQQEQVAGQIYAQSGSGAWAADSCPGT